MVQSLRDTTLPTFCATTALCWHFLMNQFAEVPGKNTGHRTATTVTHKRCSREFSNQPRNGRISTSYRRTLTHTFIHSCRATHMSSFARALTAQQIRSNRTTCFNSTLPRGNFSLELIAVVKPRLQLQRRFNRPTQMALTTFTTTPSPKGVSVVVVVVLCSEEIRHQLTLNNHRLAATSFCRTVPGRHWT